MDLPKNWKLFKILIIVHLLMTGLEIIAMAFASISNTILHRDVAVFLLFLGFFLLAIFQLINLIYDFRLLKAAFPLFNTPVAINKKIAVVLLVFFFVGTLAIIVIFYFGFVTEFIDEHQSSHDDIIGRILLLYLLIMILAGIYIGTRQIKLISLAGENSRLNTEKLIQDIGQADSFQ